MHSPECLVLLWTPPPTVICGRHQDIEAEVNVPFCEEHNIAIVRRQSGGGTVYADRGNLMISFVVPSSHHEEVYADYMQTVSAALAEVLQTDVITTQHNDILLGGHKISGTACYALPQATIVHGTLLCDVDLTVLEQAITPSEAKLAKHAVASVRQRVMNLTDLDKKNDAPYMKHHLSRLLTTSSREATAAEIAAIDQLYQ